MEGAHYQNRLISTRFLVRSLFQVLKGMPISHSHQPTWFGGCPSLTFHINPSFLEGCPSLTFHQPKFFRGVPISHFSSTRVFQRASPKKLGLMKSERWAPLWKTWVDEKWEMGTPLKNLGWWKVRDGHPSENLVWWKVRDGHLSKKLGLMESERWVPPKPCGLMKVRDGYPFGLMHIPKNTKFV